MRIALVIYGSLETVSGDSLYDRKLVEQLRSRGHDVEIVSLPLRSYARYLADNLSFAWRRRVRALDVDLVLEDERSHPSLVFSPRPVRADGTHPPIVAIVHYLFMSEGESARLRPLHRPFRRAVKSRYLRRASAFIFNSKAAHRSVEAMLPALPPHIVSLPGGDHGIFSDSSSLREGAPVESSATSGAQADNAATQSRDLHALRDPDDSGDSIAPLRAVFAGNLTARTGLHILIAALVATNAPITVDVAGIAAGSDADNPQYAARVRAQIEAAGLNRRVRFLGPLSNRERAALYMRSDLFVLPICEDFGIVYLEAMACGLPVIAPTTGAAHEIVNAGGNGFLVAPNDAATLARYLTALARDPSLLAEMSAAARAAFATFPTWDEGTTRVAHFLEELVATQEPPAQH